MFKITGKLATLNEHIAAERRNRYAGGALKKNMTNMVAWQLKGHEPIQKPCILTFNWLYSSKADFDNIRFAVKYILDGMVIAGILRDDSQKWVVGFGGDYFTKVDKGDEGVIVEIEEVDL